MPNIRRGKRRPTLRTMIPKIRVTSKIQRKILRIVSVSAGRGKITPSHGMRGRLKGRTKPKKLAHLVRHKIRKMPTLISMFKKKRIRPLLGYIDAKEARAEKILGPSRIVRIELTENGKKFFEGNGQILIPIVAQQMHILQLNIYRLGVNYIHRYVPEDTGDLRADILESLTVENNILPSINTLDYHDLVLDIKISTEVGYAKFVNDMTQKKLRHYGNKRSWRTGRMLYDPSAVHHFFEKTRKEIKKQMKISGVNNFIKTIGVNTNMFKVTY